MYLAVPDPAPRKARISGVVGAFGGVGACAAEAPPPILPDSVTFGGVGACAAEAPPPILQDLVSFGGVGACAAEARPPILGDLTSCWIGTSSSESTSSRPRAMMVAAAVAAVEAAISDPQGRDGSSWLNAT